MLELKRHTTFVFLAGLSLAGCSLAGDRALTGACPAGETCSSETPEGLFFLGAGFSDGVFGPGGVATVAAGGIETVTVLTGEDSTSPTFGGSFTVTSADQAALGIDFVTPPSFQVHGHAPGTSLVKVLDPGTGELFDQVDLQAETISSVTLLPAELTFLAFTEPPMQGDPSWALLAGNTAGLPLIVQLHGTGMDRLVDEGTALTADSGQAARQVWDLYEVPVPASAGQVSLAVQAGLASFSVSAKVVSSVDTIAMVAYFTMPALANVVSTTETTPICFVAQSGGAMVAGASWTFTPSASLTMNPQEPVGETSLSWPSCVVLQAKAPGPATITVAASGLSQTFDIVVNESKNRTAPHPHAAPRRPVQAAAGDRAAWREAR